MKKAKEKIKASNVTFLAADITKKWPDEIPFVDLVTCNLILEHIEDLNFIFAEASKKLVNGGKFYISELHPFRQYQGKKARFEREGETTHINAFIHNISDFIKAADSNNFKILKLKEWWHEDDENKAPRLITFLFKNNFKTIDHACCRILYGSDGFSLICGNQSHPCYPCSIVSKFH